MRTDGAPLVVPAPALVRAGAAWRVTAVVDGAPLWVESEDAPLAPRTEAVVSAMLVPALEAGRTLVVEGEVDPGFVRNVDALAEVLRSWWACPGRVAWTRVAASGAPPETAAGLAFSGGADSFHALRCGPVRPDVLVHVHGIDVPVADRRRAAAAQGSVREVAAAVGARAVVARTNVREHPTFRAAAWDRSHGGALFLVGHALSSVVGRLRVAASWHEGLPCPYGTHPRTDALFGATHLAVETTGTELSRFDKLRALVGDPLVARHLRVCWVNESPSLNCGRCEKCVRTRLVLEQAGVAASFPAMPAEPPLERAIDRLPQASLWVHAAHAAIELGRGLRPPVAAALRRFLARSRPPGAPARADHAWASGPAPRGGRRAPGPWRLRAPRVERDGDDVRVVADVAGAPLWFASRDASVAPRAEAFASALLVPALLAGVRLEVEAPLDASLVEGLVAHDAIVRSWWGSTGPAATFHDVRAVPASRAGGVAFAFGGGASSFDALARGLVRPDLLVTAVGLDVDRADLARAALAERSLRAVAAARGARAAVVRTNLREHPAFAGVESVPCEGGVLAALGHLLAGEAGTLAVGAPQHGHYVGPHGIHPRTLPLLGSSAVALRLVGDDRWRGQKVVGLAADALARAHLRVCREARGPSANCSRCAECLRTMVGLQAAGALDRFDVFDRSEPLAARLDRLSAVDEEWALSFEADLGRGLPSDTARAVRDLLARCAPPRPSRLVRALRRLRRHVLRARARR